MKEIEVVNIVATTCLADTFNLELIAKHVNNTIYEPERFPGLIYHLDKPKTAMLLFRSGKVNCTGAKKIEDVYSAINILIDKLKGINILLIDSPEITVQNMVAIYDIKYELKLNALAVSLGLEFIEYEPEQFPGLVYRMDDPHVVLLIFTTGKIVCTGAKSVEDIELSVERLTRELRKGDYIP